MALGRTLIPVCCGLARYLCENGSLSLPGFLCLELSPPPSGRPLSFCSPGRSLIFGCDSGGPFSFLLADVVPLLLTCESGRSLSFCSPGRSLIFERDSCHFLPFGCGSGRSLKILGCDSTRSHQLFAAKVVPLFLGVTQVVPSGFCSPGRSLILGCDSGRPLNFLQNRSFADFEV